MGPGEELHLLQLMQALLLQIQQTFLSSQVQL